MDQARMNILFYEMLSWPKGYRANMALCLLNSMIGEEGGMIDAATFDRGMEREVYIVGAVGPSADLLRLYTAKCVRETPGERTTIKEGDEPTPFSKPIERNDP